LTLTVPTVASAPRAGFLVAAVGIPTPLATVSVNHSSGAVSATVNQSARSLTLPAVPAKQGWPSPAAVATVGMSTKARDSGVDNQGQGETLLTGTWGASFFTRKSSTGVGPMIRADLASAVARQSRIHDAVLAEELSDSFPRELAWVSDVAHALAGRADDLDSMANILDDMLAAGHEA
jgi:hypothetical protein